MEMIDFGGFEGVVCVIFLKEFGDDS